MRIPLLLAAVVALAVQSLPQTGSIRVIVRDGLTSQPMPNVAVTMANFSGTHGGTLLPRVGVVEIRISSTIGTTIRTVDGQTLTMTGFARATIPRTTNSAGVAEFSGLAVGGTFSFSVQHENAVATETLTLTSSAADIVLSIYPKATISGTVHDAGGRPFPNANVWLGMPTILHGRSLLASVASTRTDSNGEYSFALARPGSYYIRAEPSAASMGLAGAYYPGVIEIEKASMIPVRPGDNLVAIDFGIPEQPTFTVAGRVESATTAIPAVVVVGAQNPNAPALVATLTNQGVRGDGQFLLSGIPAGTWDLYPTLPAPFRAHTRITVANNVEGLTIVADSSFKDVRVLVSGLPGDGTAQPVDIRLLPITPATSQTASGFLATGNGEYVLRALSPGPYRLMLQPPLGYFLSDLRAGANSVVDGAAIVEVAEAMTLPIQITFAAGGGSIRGTIAGSAELSAASRVLLVPSGSRRDNLLLYKTNTVASESRSFTFENVPPGDYKVFAWKSPPYTHEGSAGVVALYEDRGVPIRVVDGMTASVQVPLILE